MDPAVTPGGGMSPAHEPSLTPGMTVRVRSAHAASTEAPVVLHEGDHVSVGHESEEWPGWRWCIARDGREGWVPEDVLDVEDALGVALGEYDAAELEVWEGELLTVVQQLAGWLLHETPEGRRGWLPGDCVEPHEA